MKRLHFFLGILLAVFAFAPPVFAEEVIHTFDVKADLTFDRRLTVTETLDYDFDDLERHGIYRKIPNVYDRNGGKYRLGIAFLEATMDGQPIPWTTETDGSYEVIRIGDANQYVTGRHTYALTYRTDRAINDFADHRELYWNVTGNEWGVTVENVWFALHGPGEANQTACYSGSFGSTSQECAIAAKGNDVTASNDRVFGTGEGLTVVIGYPLGALRAQTLWEKIALFVEDNFWVMLPFFVFAAMFAVWHRYGKEPRGRGTVVPQYEEPQGLAPGYMVGLLEQRVSHRAITATILDLARRGYLKVRYEEKGKFTFLKGEELKKAEPFEVDIWTGLFRDGAEVKMEDLKGVFWKDIQEAHTNVFEGLRNKRLFGTNPSVVRALWVGVASAVFVGSFFLSTLFGEAFIVTGLLCGFIIAMFGWQMPQMTKDGAVAVEEIKGFKWFLSVTEQARLDFSDAPERKPNEFARFLPAAVAFGVEQKWAKQFADMAIQPPSYFTGTARGWTAMQFANAVDDFHAASAHSLYPAPSSAGGGGSGFSGGGSGGGFGGGGGGSW